jgi:branched-chain amino acid transport system ATP-binding protein
MNALTVESLVAGYGGRAIIDGISLRVGAGEVVTIIGHNGAGKSTLLKAVFSLLRPSAGRVMLGTREVTGLPSRDLLLAGLAYVPQEHSVFPKLTVAENLRMGAYLIDDEALYRQRVERVIALFPILADRMGQLAGLMSGGEQRMLEIARTLLMDPQVIMLDEPSIGLAPKMVDAVFGAVAALKAAGKSVLIVEQNVRKALQAADRGYALELGRVVLEDRAAALVDDDRVAKLYMGAAKRAV